jgi:aspartyl-tRNA(Asn)/glutamyl-tRNA(Gln) amidotransferase subunit A
VEDLADLSLTEAARALERGSISALELTEACLGRAELLEPVLKSFTTLDQQRAIDRARSLSNAQTRAGLFGIPVAIKDIIDVAGLPTTASSKVLPAAPASADAPVTASLRAHDAVIVGKTNTHEFAYGVVTPPTRNPWDPARIPGGSSGGSAVAVAAGMALGALGTDTAGSIRIPASLCGIAGFKPRRGAVPMEGIIPLSWTLDSCGPLARSAADVDLMWQALAGAPAAEARSSGLVVGAPSLPEVAEVDPEVAELVDAALRALAEAGSRRIEVALPDFKTWDRPRSILLAVEALAAHREAGWYPERIELYSSETLGSLRHAETISGADFVAARRTLERLAVNLMAAFNAAEVLALPSTPLAAPRADDVSRRTPEHFRPEVVLRLTHLCGPINWCPLAAVSVPCGFTEAGLPVGLQLVARDEATALAAALGYQRLTDWHERRPSTALVE